MSDSASGWIKSSRSMGSGACVELTVADDKILLRNSRDPQKQLAYTIAEMSAFFDAVRDREFDHLLDRARSWQDPA